jgi:hypothetical protein
MPYDADVSEFALHAALEDGGLLASQTSISQPWILGGASSAVLACDFYRECDDTVRGVVLGDSCTLQESGMFHSPKDVFELAEFVEPREVPWGGVASTSLLVPRSSAAAAEILSAVGGFLQNQASVAVQKMNPKKHSIRAAAWFKQLGSCDLKARLFQLLQGEWFVLEFARRSGCALAFAEVSQRATGFLVERFEGVRAAEGVAISPIDDVVSSLVSQPAPGPLLQGAYDPLREAAVGSTDPESQLGAIAALVVARAGCAAAAACLAEVLAGGALDILLQDPRMHVAASAELLRAELAVQSLCRG